MKWFNDWFENKVRESWGNENTKLGSISILDEINMTDSFSLKVLPARGGTVIQVHKYERKTDRNRSFTYVVSEEESLSERIAQIVSMEIISQ
jgi:hypothetical protein